MQTPYDIALVIRAVAFAAQKQRMQRRKDSHASPYINHPVALCTCCALTAASSSRRYSRLLLHDTIEDTEATEVELRTMFGDEIASLVLEMTGDTSLPKVARKRLQIEHLRSETARVKLADKIGNLCDVAANPPTEWSLERWMEYFEWAKAVVDGLPQVSAELLGLFNAAYAARPRG